MNTRDMLAVLALARLAMDAGADHDTVTGLTAALTGEPLDLIERVLGASPSTEDQVKCPVCSTEHVIGEDCPNYGSGEKHAEAEPVVHAWGTNGYTKCRKHKFVLSDDESIAILGQPVTCLGCITRM